MEINFRRGKNKWIAEVWTPNRDPFGESNLTYDEDTYIEINNWCKDTLGYHCRTAYHIFEFKKKSHLEWFILRWA